MATFAQRFARVAQQQHNRFHLMRETQSPLREQIRRYWVDLGLSFPGVSTAWSAVFVSWCAKQAGATAADFPFSQRHSRFVHRFIRNARNGTGSFRAFPVSDYSPVVGDIIQNNRDGNTFDYAFAETHQEYASHTAVVVEVGFDAMGAYLRTIGGNESDSVGLKEVRLTRKGRVQNPDGIYICVVQTLLGTGDA